MEHSKRVQAASMRGFPGRPPCPEPLRGSQLGLGPGKARSVSAEPLLVGIGLTKSYSLGMLETGVHGSDILSRMGTSSTSVLPTLPSRSSERLPARGGGVGRGQQLLTGSQILDTPVPVLPW